MVKENIMIKEKIIILLNYGGLTKLSLIDISQIGVQDIASYTILLILTGLAMGDLFKDAIQIVHFIILGNTKQSKLLDWIIQHS